MELKKSGGGWATVLRWLVWTGIGLLGAGAFAVVALARGEGINALWLVTAGLCAFAISYRFYSKWLVTRVLLVDDARVTPAVRLADGKDYVPTSKWMVFGHHFAAIAGPGPLVGPVLASQFGYLPGTIWLLVGATLGGAVQDLVMLCASVRRNGRSLGQMIKEELGPWMGGVALLSILAIMVILLAVLALVVVKAMAESPWGVFTIVMTIPIAMGMGLGLRSGRMGVRGVTVLGVLGLLGAVWAGQFLSDYPQVESWFRLGAVPLAWGVIGYGLAATVLPVWLLLAPRDYLSTFMKLGAVVVLALAVLWIQPELKMPALTSFVDGSGLVFAGQVFPFVCITIACGAISGFHALIATGTTPKLITKESEMRLVGYGAMVVEMMVGLMALIAACALEPGQYFAINMKGSPAEVVAQVSAAGFPVTEAEMAHLAEQVGETTMIGRTGGAPTFAVGMAMMFARVLNDPTTLALWYHFAIMFEALFILTTIDAGTRVGRFLVQEILGHVWRPLGDTQRWDANLLASGLFVAAWGWFLIQGVMDPLGGINSLWPIFGIANQLLAVMALGLGTTLLLKWGKRHYAWVTLGPLLFLFTAVLAAGWIKLFAEDPRLGFLSGAAFYREQAAVAVEPAAVAKANTLAFNLQMNAGVTALFLTLVLVVMSGCAARWVRLLRESASHPSAG